MEPQITALQDWYIVDSPFGTTILPADIVGDAETFEPSDDTSPLDPKLQPFCDCDHAYGVERVTKIGVRFFMPGYLDCTSWSRFDTKEDAQEFLDQE